MEIMQMGRKMLVCIGAMGVLCAGKAAAFSDVPAEAFYAPAVERLQTAGIVQGYADGTFRPMETVSMSELLTMVYRMTEGTAIAPEQLIERAMAEGLLLESTRQQYAALQEEKTRAWYLQEQAAAQATRGQAARVLVTTRGLQPVALNELDMSAVTDVGEMLRLYGLAESVVTAWGYGILNGDSTGALRARDRLTRAEACVMVLRAREAKTLVRPENEDEPHVVIDDTIRTEERDNAVETAGKCLSELRVLDARFLRMLARQSWTIGVCNVQRRYSGIAGNAVGVCVRTERFVGIAVGHADSTLHEIGHVIDAMCYEKTGTYVSQSEAFRVAYDGEKGAYLGAMTNNEHLTQSPSEFFAAVFRDMAWRWARCWEITPQTGELVEQAYALLCSGESERP